MDASTSKMPPQQSHGLLDRFDKRFGFGTHGIFPSSSVQQSLKPCKLHRRRVQPCKRFRQIGLEKTPWQYSFLHAKSSNR
jgi:hypothetical protein